MTLICNSVFQSLAKRHGGGVEYKLVAKWEENNWCYVSHFLLWLSKTCITQLLGKTLFLQQSSCHPHTNLVFFSPVRPKEKKAQAQLSTSKSPLIWGLQTLNRGHNVYRLCWCSFCSPLCPLPSLLLSLQHIFLHRNIAYI